MTSPRALHVEAFYDPATFTLTYAVHDPATRDAVVIDPVLDYEPQSATTRTASLERLDAYLRRESLRVRWVLETHAHADHLSGAQWLKTRHGASVAIGARITEVQRTFRDVYDLPATFPTDGRQFDQLLVDGEALAAGSFEVRALSTPGHTPACMSFVIGDAVFTGDALFMEDYGTGRCDFPSGSADDLYHSVHEVLYSLPPHTRVFVGHDYQPGGRPMRYETTIEASRERNVQLSATTTSHEFVALRRARDATLAAPRLLWPSVQVNIDAGRLPEPSPAGTRYLRIPLNLRSPTHADGTPR